MLRVVSSSACRVSTCARQALPNRLGIVSRANESQLHRSNRAPSDRYIKSTSRSIHGKPINRNNAPDVPNSGHASGDPSSFKMGLACKIAVPLGVGAGAFGSLVGNGGGVLMSPIMQSVAGAPARVMSGSSLLAVMTTSVAAAGNYAESGECDIARSIVIATASVLTAAAGARATSRLSNVALKRVLGWFLIVSAPMVPVRTLFLQSPGSRVSSDCEQHNGNSSFAVMNDHNSSTNPLTTQRPWGHFRDALRPKALQKQFSEFRTKDWAPLIVTGSIAGFASGLLGIGGGAIVTPLMALTTDLPYQTVLGTSLLAMIPPSMIAFRQHVKLGNVRPRLAGLLAIGTAFGAFGGSQIALAAPSGVLETLFCVAMIGLGRSTLKASPLHKAMASRARFKQ